MPGPSLSVCASISICFVILMSLNMSKRKRELPLCLLYMPYGLWRPTQFHVLGRTCKGGYLKCGKTQVKPTPKSLHSATQTAIPTKVGSSVARFFSAHETIWTAIKQGLKTAKPRWHDYGRQVSSGSTNSQAVLLPGELTCLCADNVGQCSHTQINGPRPAQMRSHENHSNT